MSDQPKVYSTTDLYLGAYLKARGVRLIDVEKSGRRATFLFENPNNKIKALLQEFYNDGMVRISDFQHSLKDLKSFTFNTT